MRVQINLETPDEDKNDRRFAFLMDTKEQIEGEYGAALKWRNTENVKSCRVIDSYTIDTTDSDNWPEAIEWQRLRMEAMIKTFAPYIPEIAAL